MIRLPGCAGVNDSCPKISSPADAGDEILPGCAGFNDSFPKISSPADAGDEILPGCAGYLLLLKGRDQGHCGNSVLKSWKE